MKIDVIGVKSFENRLLVKEIKSRGLESDYADPRKVSYAFRKNKLRIYLTSTEYKIPDAVICRGGFISKIEQEGRQLIHVLEQLGVLLIEKPHLINRDKDKMFFAMLFMKHKIPTPDTFYLRNKTLLKIIDFSPVIVKHQRGRKGKNIFKFDKLEKLPSKSYFIQNMISNSHVDKRVFVIGDKVIGAMERRAAKKGEWRSNLALGGSAKAVKVDDKTKNLAIRAAKACEYEIAGVDIITDKQGKQFVIEVNRAPQFRGLMKATGINVAGKIVDYVEKRVKTHSKAR
ncbi:MAG: RimK family alpha-L-glutamate ligase [Nanoarchaeota archaeon]|nr:RimK family alpha-L-glutamate ligase [Nanoarchaeota archaeon]MBU1321970.1 RimK family alpha-L-glutamate ligase [Nanoarchaeota archaeon]MBU1598306.1 RimK family alpha-L-glutamate ligase [Nanoarchaeota archaeon]MBU2441796.1 RimK family alpha-L-glutamate ligase [Nanoarchaeota archaeon]